MTNDERRQQMDFILEQQAQLTATVGRISERIDSLSEKVERNANGIGALLTIAEIHEREVTAVNESIRTVDERQRQADERQRQAYERQREADERLNALINTVERYISERRNGKP
ncbi:MAG TPA: hypothetical protein VM934_11345 [Pyrinomonadaceae bacterium]|jgi:DNA-binding ferritin-like protein|nr:hypothetical protein [Pyrinomonadaceae bacterium]